MSLPVSELYIEDLQDALMRRKVSKRRVLFAGKALGKELQSMTRVGATPVLANLDSSRDLSLEALLMQWKVRYDGPYILWDLKEDFHHVVLSGDLDNPTTVINTVLTLMPVWGYVMFPAEMSHIREELEFRGLQSLDVFRKYAAVYLKHPGLPEDWE